MGEAFWAHEPLRCALPGSPARTLPEPRCPQPSPKPTAPGGWVFESSKHAIPKGAPNEGEPRSPPERAAGPSVQEAALQLHLACQTDQVGLAQRYLNYLSGMSHAGDRGQASCDLQRPCGVGSAAYGWRGLAAVVSPFLHARLSRRIGPLRPGVAVGWAILFGCDVLVVPPGKWMAQPLMGGGTPGHQGAVPRIPGPGPRPRMLPKR